MVWAKIFMTSYSKLAGKEPCLLGDAAQEPAGRALAVHVDLKPQNTSDPDVHVLVAVQVAGHELVSWQYVLAVHVGRRICLKVKQEKIYAFYLIPIHWSASRSHMYMFYYFPSSFPTAYIILLHGDFGLSQATADMGGGVNFLKATWNNECEACGLDQALWDYVLLGFHLNQPALVTGKLYVRKTNSSFKSNTRTFLFLFDGRALSPVLGDYVIYEM